MRSRSISNSDLAYGVSTQILDPVDHFLRVKDRSEQFEKTHPFSDAMFVLLAKDDAGMFDAGRSKFYVIGVIGTEDIAKARCAGKMVVVAIAQEAEVTDLSLIHI